MNFYTDNLKYVQFKDRLNIELGIEEVITLHQIVADAIMYGIDIADENLRKDREGV